MASKGFFNYEDLMSMPIDELFILIDEASNVFDKINKQAKK